MSPIDHEREIILRIIKGLDEAQPVGPHRREMWNRCWEEEPGPVPTYMDSEIVRYRDQFWHSQVFEKRFLTNLRAELYEDHISGSKDLFEFGAGLGQNLLPFKDRCRVYGFDWSEAAVQRMAKAGIVSGLFDMFHPDMDVPIGGAAVLTVHAMEQLGRNFGGFLDFLLRKKPAVVVHIEPLYELYDGNKLLDNLAMRYHEKREYLVGYLPALQELEARCEIDIIQCRRSFAGNLFHDAYSVLVWRPR